ncbi:MAG: helicase-related protein [Chloroflexota bacterium]|nr:helicase-related protein [Chloroflexota bacterium]
MAERVTFAPGARIVVRDEEWLVKSALPTSTGGAAVRAVGLSELVRNHEAVFLSELDRMTELRPEETQLVPDDSPQYRKSRLFLESLLRRTPPTDDQIHLGDQGAFNYTPYQMTPTHMALEALRPRILIADGVGLGKTIEAGILLAELIKRGRGERILVIAVRSMLTQFQQEIWARFSIPLVRLDSVGLRRVRARIPSNKNPFYYYNRVIISIDTLKNDAQYRHYLEQCHWDVIVIDECHNVANFGSQRNRLATLLARTCDSLILTSATPHNGRAESFANLINMLDPTAIADVHDYTSEEIKGLFTRRFKKDIEEQVEGQFSERTVELESIPASVAEECFFDRLGDASFATLHRGGSMRDALYRIGLLKAFLSSPIACTRTIEGRLKRIGKRLQELGEGPLPEIDLDDEIGAGDEDLLAAELEISPAERAKRISELKADFETLSELHALATAVDTDTFRKYQRLVSLLRELGADASRTAPRIIVFSERIATLYFLQEQLIKEFGADEDSVVVFHAGLPDVEQQHIVEDFGKEDSPKRILIASDVASEGVNLHYFCHLMVHFDIPWSLITMEQRNGRIDRYGQHTPPFIHYLLTISQNRTIKGDMRVLERLIEKEAEAQKNIGDAATILGLHDAQREEKQITEGVAEGKTPEEIIPDQSPESDWLAILMGGADEGDGDMADYRGESFSLFNDDIAFSKAAFGELVASDQVAQLPEYHPQRPEFSLLANEDLQRRCEFMPNEAVPDDWTFRLTTDRDRVMQAIADARKRQGEWPREQLFWDPHPTAEWLLDKLMVRFGRHEAPVILTPDLQADEAIFLFQGVMSNARSQPVIASWFGLHTEGGSQWMMLNLKETLGLSGFVDGLANPGAPSSQQVNAMAALLPGAVDAARDHMESLRMNRADSERRRLQEDMRRLKQWHQKKVGRIEAELANARGARRARLQYQLDETNKIYESRQQWLRESFSTDPTPYLRVATVFAGMPA